MSTRDDAAIRQRLESWVAAFRAKDVPGVMAHYAPDVVSYDLAPPLLHRGAEVRTGFAEWFPTWDGPIGLEIRDLTIQADGDLAFTHALHHLTGTRADGSRTDVWFRATVGLRKSGDTWTIVHEHTSVPFYMDGSFKAAVDLRP
jgi:PhnB protein